MIETLDDFGVEFKGFRPLERGRILLCFYNKAKKDDELRIYDVWEGFKDRRYIPFVDEIFDQEVFSKMFYYGDYLCWSFQMDLYLGELYIGSELIDEEDFYCVK